MGVVDVIREAFTEARAYQKEWQAYEAAKASGATGSVPPRRDLELEPLVEIMEGTRLVHAHCYRADEILQLLRVAEEFDFRIATLQHVLEGYKVAKEIAEHGAGASTFSDWWAYKMEAYDAIPHNAALMTEKGCARLDQLRQCRRGAPSEPRGGEDDEVGAGSPKTKPWRSSPSTRRNSSGSTIGLAPSRWAKTPTSRSSTSTL